MMLSSSKGLANSVHHAHVSGRTAHKVIGTSLHRSGRSSQIGTKAALKPFETAAGSWVLPAKIRKPEVLRGVVHFIGGAFVGAAPQVAYSLFMDTLSRRGYTVIATPYAISFDHRETARKNRQQFLDSLAELKDIGLSIIAPESASVFGVGHSNGALMHLLGGCSEIMGDTAAGEIAEEAPTSTSIVGKQNAGNVIISYNNKQVSDAIPIPGFLEALGPSVRNSRTAGPLPVTLPSAQDFLQNLSDRIPAELLPGSNKERLAKAQLLLEQLGLVVNEVGDGQTDFTPSPSESRAIIAASYRVSPTLLMMFDADSIDETPEMASTLSDTLGAGLSVLTLSGGHATPCALEGSNAATGPGAKWGPLDTIGTAVRASSQAGTLKAANQTADWLDAVPRL